MNLDPKKIQRVERALKWKPLKTLEFVGFRSVLYGSKFKTRMTIQTEVGVEKTFYHIDGDTREYTDFYKFVCRLVEFWDHKYVTLLDLLRDRKEDKK